MRIQRKSRAIGLREWEAVLGKNRPRQSANIDCFFTEPKLAEALVRVVLQKYRLPKDCLFVEPSAGAGAFVRPLRKAGHEVLAVDISPAARGIRRADFLAASVIPAGRHAVVIGNPPFGFAASTAVRFFNRAAERARMIAFIVPRTFRKASVQDRLDMNFHLAHDQDIPKLAFLKDGRPHDVPCAFQVWVRRSAPRKQRATPDVSHLVRFTTPDKAHFGLRRVGGRAGEVLPGTDHSTSTTYFIRGVRPGIRHVLEELDWKKEREQTAGVRSVSKREVAWKLLEAVK